MRYKITSFDYLLKTISDLNDDLTKPWDTYPCLEWPRCLRNGYGRLRHNSKAETVHRLAFEHIIGEIPEGFDVCHHCDNPPCFRPIHLFASSCAGNMQDMLIKGRRYPTIGEANPKCILREQDVVKIRELFIQVTRQRILARDFNVSKSAINHVINRRSWPHIK